ncbi:porin family protein [Spirosoma migulaei]
MPELTDDQLDGLFRKSVEEFDTPFDPAAWQDMKARLDANDRTTPSSALIWKNLLRWGLPVALLMLLTGGGWFIYRKANPGTATTSVQKVAEARAKETTIAKGVHQSATPQLAETQRPTELTTSSPEPMVSEVGPSANRAESAKETTREVGESAKNPLRNVERSANKPGSLETSVEKSEMSKPTGLSKSTRTALARKLTKTVVATKSIPSSYKLASGRNRTKRMRSDSELVGAMNSEEKTNRLSSVPLARSRTSIRKLRKQRNASQDLVVLSATGYTGSPMPSFTKRSGIDRPKVAQSTGLMLTGSPLSPGSEEATSVLLPTVNELSVRPARWPKNLAFTGRLVEPYTDTTAQRVVSNASIPVQRGLSVRFVVAPDLSTIGLKNFTRPGTNVGLLLEYRLASRWSIQVGVIKSTKVYKALPSEYNAPTTWWQPPMKSPDLVDGRCNMFDIPINIRYDVVIKPRSDGRLPDRWFVSSGVTSYIMKQEEYYYTYPAHTYNQPTEYSPSGGNTGGYRFSNLNLSFGYERSFSRRLSWQVEPFMKAPLKGVGFFKVNLLSTGAFFSLRYKL